MRDMAAALAKAKADAESSRAAAAELAMTVEVPTFVLSLAPLRASSLAFPSRLYVPLLVPVSRTRPPLSYLCPEREERGDGSSVLTIFMHDIYWWYQLWY